MKALQKVSKFLSDYTSIVVIAIAVVTFFLPSMMGWVNLALFTDMVSNKFTCQSIIIGIIMFSMGLTLTTEDFRILAQRPFDICVGAVAQYLIMPFLALCLPHDNISRLYAPLSVCSKKPRLSDSWQIPSLPLPAGRAYALCQHRVAHF